MTPRRLGWTCFWLAHAVVPALFAEPRNTVWLEDVHLQSKGTTETAFVYEFQSPDFNAVEEGVDLFALRLGAGVGEAVEVAPLGRFRQRGDEALRLHELGAEVRGRILGDVQTPHLVLYGSYLNALSEDRDHHLTAGGSGRYDFDRLFVAGDLRFSTLLGGELEDAREVWIGAGAGYAFLPERELSAGLETFAILPIAGLRVSDPTFGEAGEAVSFYYGPSVSLRGGPFWTALSATTGFPVSDAASHLLLRWMLGVSH
jgi:hypothetical protein